MWNATFKTGLNSSKYGIHTFSFISPSTGTHERNKSTSSRLSGFIAIGRALHPSEVAWICLESENGLKGNWRQKDKFFFYHAHYCFPLFCGISVVFPPALRLRMEEWGVIFAAYDVWYGKTCESAPYRGSVFDWCLSWILSQRRNSKTTKNISTAALVFLDSRYHTSQQGADLVFEPALKRQKQWEKPNFERNFLAKNKTRRNNPTHLISLILAFSSLKLSS